MPRPEDTGAAHPGWEPGTPPMRNDRARWRTLRPVRRLRLIVIIGLAAFVVAAGGLGGAAPADAATPNLVGRTLTMTSDSADDDITLRATGTAYELVHGTGTSTFLRSNVETTDQLVIEVRPAGA